MEAVLVSRGVAASMKKKERSRERMRKAKRLFCFVESPEN